MAPVVPIKFRPFHKLAYSSIHPAKMAKVKKVIIPLKKAFNNYNSVKSKHCRNARLSQGYLTCTSVQAQNNYLCQVVLPKIANAINVITSQGSIPLDWPVLTVHVDKGKGKGKEIPKSSDNKSKGKGKEITKSDDDKGKGKGKKRPKSSDDKGDCKKKKCVKELSTG
jgi:hypothetical protein